MPDEAPTPLRDTARTELLTAGAEALHRLAPDLPAAARALMERLHAAIPTPALATIPAEALAEAAASLFSLAAERRPGQTLIRVVPPGPGRGPRAVAEIVTDDMPFLVDSVLATLTLKGRVAERLLHPIVPVKRDGTGRIAAIENGAPRESMMRVTLANGAEEELPAIEQAVARTLADLRISIADFPAMLQRLVDAGTEMAAYPDGEAAPAAAFLRWMADENFVLLGHRKLALAANGDLDIVEGEGLGLLRDEGLPVFDALRDLDAVPEAVKAALVEATPIAVAKANMRSSIHRPQHADVVATRFLGPDGKVAGVRFFLGLFAAAAYNRNPRSIPWLAEKVQRIIGMAGVDPGSHDGRAIRNILDTWPRDELFQAPDAAVLAGARQAVDLQLRPRAALALRRDPFERFVSAIVWLPRDTFDTRLRERVGGMLARAFDGRLSAYHIALGDAPLARIHYVIGTVPGRVPPVADQTLEAAINDAARSFRDRVGEALATEQGEAAAARLLARWGDAFPPGYRETSSAAQGIGDLALAEAALASGRPAARLERPAGATARSLTLRLANPGGPLPLADALPLFESLDLRAIEEVPHRLEPAGTDAVVLHVFSLQAGADCPESRFPKLLEALSALLAGAAEADGFNRLVLRAGLAWRESWLLRAMYRWLKQVGFAFSQESVAAALAAHPDAARILVDLFIARFDPARARGDEGPLDTAWAAMLDGVDNPDDDRILARLRTLLDAMLRTNYFQGKDYVAFKLDSAQAGDMPAPRPWREIFVHAVRMEGCHLRAGPVARGGIRWSDRREDFRTEILGLMKAQRLKNVVIVPTGAKGGFILKHPPPASDREAFMAEGIACYRTLVSAMLDLADNYHGFEVVTPEGIVRRDGDDPYIVAAADKGTATFSDIANGLSADYGFWLGDAFASGGSQGYDHKGMGITARGAWVMIDRHFREVLGRSVQDAPFTMVGVGDMSGDVFGNGLLVSRKTKLLAAFDHRHIFLDPDPDAESAYDERARLFALPRSSWADYDVRLVSQGGGVFPRNAKTIPLSPQVRAMLGIAQDRAEPAAVMRAILVAKVDLLYFGGIGTYVKASSESQADAGDRANDAIRIDGREIGARVVGEGANLGVTQAGRIEAARQGIRINTDALDNSAGVSTSDHEVNIKILLAAAETDGAITRRQRDELLVQMTDEVAALVLRDNHQQSLAVTLEAEMGAEALPSQAALMKRLEAAGLLDRAVAGLPDDAAMRRRIASGDALTRPDIASLLPFAKLWLAEAIEESGLPDDPALTPQLLHYFPTQLREGYARFAESHRLRRQLVATILANEVANGLGCAALARLTVEAGPERAVRAAWLAGECFGLEAAADAIDASVATAAVKLRALRSLRALQEGAARGLLSAKGTLGEALAELRPGIAALIAAEAVPPADAEGLPPQAAGIAAAAGRLVAGPAVVRLAARAGVTADAAAAAWGTAGEDYALDALRAAAETAPAPGAFGPRARALLLDDLLSIQAGLAQRALGGATTPPGADAAARLARDAAASADLAGVTVAARALAALT
ncbi:MAG TPA: NAD-glutamate dehydrogenase domain-containing protein [Roseomonas sp.]|jgi:glutamate dehydrogenase